MSLNSTINQTNSLVNIGDFITIRTELPINPKTTKILGYYIITNDIIDFRENYLLGQFFILKESEASTFSENNIDWGFLSKLVEGDFNQYTDFTNYCNSQSEPYYIYFKFTKSKGTQIINIQKVSLKIADVVGLDYPFYQNSLFKEIKLYDLSHLKWTYSVLDKLNGNGIMPTWFQKDKDYSTFWSWICHIFSLFVIQGRQFLDIFKDKDLFWEYLRQKDFYRDFRGSVYEDIGVYFNQELIYKVLPNTRVITDYPIFYEGYICSDLLKIKKDVYITLSLVTIDEENYNKDITIAFYDFEKKYISKNIVSLTSETKRKTILITDTNIEYFNISYSSNSQILIKAEVSGQNYYTKKDLTKEDVLNVYKIFRKRGTQSSLDSIESIFQIEDSDCFYSGYLKNSGWYLNKTFPLLKELPSSIKLGALLPSTIEHGNIGEIINFKENYFKLSECNSLNIAWNIDKQINSISVFFGFYDKDKNPIYITKVLEDSEQRGISINKIINKEINISINILDNEEQRNLLKNSNQQNELKNPLFAFCKNTKYVNIYGEEVNCELVYTKITSVVFKYNNLLSMSNELLRNFIVNFYLSDSITLYNFSIFSNAINNNVSFTSSLGNISYEFTKEDIELGYKKFEWGDKYIIIAVPNGTIEKEVNYSNETIMLIVTTETIKEENFHITTASENASIIELNATVCLNKLPFHLGLLNNKEYYLTYYKNHGHFSDKESENIVGQKFLPYRGYKLFVNSENISNDLYKPMQFLNFEIKNTYYWGEEFGGILFKLKGGCPIFNLKISGKTSEFISSGGIIKESSIWEKEYNITNNTFVDENIPCGTYNLLITDSLGNTLRKNNIIISRVDRIEISVDYYLMTGNTTLITAKQNSLDYDTVFVTVRGGTPPYTINYIDKYNNSKNIQTNNDSIELKDLKILRGQEVSISIKDIKYDINLNPSEESFVLKTDKYLEVYDDGEGSCVI